jgi:Zn-dependent protease
MPTETLVLGLVWYGVFLFSTTLHEAAHAFAALKLGDPTAYMGGQVTLDPTPHVRRSPIGMIAVPIASFLLVGGHWMIGWASAPYDPFWAHRHPKRSAIMAAAGPAANLLLVLAAALVVRVGVSFGWFIAPAKLQFPEVTAAAAEAGRLAAAVATFVNIAFSLNLILFLFNLFPLPPLDGSSAITLFMDDATARHFQAWVRQPAFSIIGLLALNLLYPGAGYH